jgi:hypothetical protein
MNREQFFNAKTHGADAEFLRAHDEALEETEAMDVPSDDGRCFQHVMMELLLAMQNPCDAAHIANCFLSM